MRRLLGFTSLVSGLAGHRSASILGPVRSADACFGAPGLKFRRPARRLLPPIDEFAAKDRIDVLPDPATAQIAPSTPERVGAGVNPRAAATTARRLNVRHRAEATIA
jgi:hypothetical protein